MLIDIIYLKLIIIFIINKKKFIIRLDLKYKNLYDLINNDNKE